MASPDQVPKHRPWWPRCLPISLVMLLAMVLANYWFIRHDFSRTICYHRQAEIHDLLATGGCCWFARNVVGIEPWVAPGQWNPKYVEAFTYPYCPVTKEKYQGAYTEWIGMHCSYHGNLVAQYGIKYLPLISREYSPVAHYFFSVFYSQRTLEQTRLWRFGWFNAMVLAGLLLGYGCGRRWPIDR